MWQQCSFRWQQCSFLWQQCSCMWRQCSVFCGSSAVLCGSSAVFGGSSAVVCGSSEVFCASSAVFCADASTKGTIQLGQNWPAKESRHLAWLAELCGCQSITHLDINGYNLVMHLYKVANFCTPCVDIIRNMCNFGMPWPGGEFNQKDWDLASKQRTSSIAPHNWTCLHFFLPELRY